MAGNHHMHRRSRSGIYKWNIHRAISVMCNVPRLKATLKLMVNPYSASCVDSPESQSPRRVSENATARKWSWWIFLVSVFASLLIPAVIALILAFMFVERISNTDLPDLDGFIIATLTFVIMTLLIGPFVSITAAKMDRRMPWWLPVQLMLSLFVLGFLLYGWIN